MDNEKTVHDYTEIRDNEIRSKICELLSEMLDHPDKSGIYPTSEFMWKMESYILEFKAENAELKLALADKIVTYQNNETKQLRAELAEAKAENERLRYALNEIGQKCEAALESEG